LIYVDSDNALGSRSGDIDDGIALAVLLRSGKPVEALASTFGNTTASAALENHRRLAAQCGFAGSCLAGSAHPDAPAEEASVHLTKDSRARTVLALGPLTNLARALEISDDWVSRIDEVVCLGSNASSRGRWPPLWPFEFNFTKDARSLVRVFESQLPLTIVPLDQAGRLRVRFSDLDALDGALGHYIREHAKRWFVRARRLKLQATVPVWDLVAVAQHLWPELFRFDEVSAGAHANGWVQWNVGERRVRRVSDFDPAQVWARSVQLLNAAAESRPAPALDKTDSLRRSG